MSGGAVTASRERAYKFTAIYYACYGHLLLSVEFTLCYIMENVTPQQFNRLLDTLLVESDTPSSDMSETDTDDTATSPPVLFPAQVQQQVHAQQVQLSRRRMHANTNSS